VVEDKLQALEEKISVLEGKMADLKKEKARYEDIGAKLHSEICRLEAIRTTALDGAYRLQGEIYEMLDWYRAALDRRDELNDRLNYRDKQETDTLTAAYPRRSMR